MAKDYKTATEKADEAFHEGLDSLPTQKAKREVLEKAAELIPVKEGHGADTINGKTQVELESAEPVAVKVNAFGNKIYRGS